MIIRIKKIKVSLLLGVGLVILSSCGPGSTIKYSVLNKTAKPFNLKYQFPGGLLMHSETIRTGATKAINKEKRLGDVDDINKRLDSISFNTLILEQDGIISHADFKDKKYWIFKKEDDWNATFTLIVDSTLAAR